MLVYGLPSHLQHGIIKRGCRIGASSAGLQRKGAALAAVRPPERLKFAQLVTNHPGTAPQPRPITLPNQDGLGRAINFASR
jgi:hypothetical protein